MLSQKMRIESSGYEVRKITRANNDLTISMDSYDTVEEISNLFADMYDMLYNKVSYNKEEMSKLVAEIDTLINTECLNNTKSLNHSHTIKDTDVREAINRLKLGKK